METNDPETPENSAGMPQHWQRLAAKITEVSHRIAREIRIKLVASGVDPRSIDDGDDRAAAAAEPRSQKRRFKRRHRRGGEEPPKYRPIG